jgi:hypothetical protein
MRNKCVRWAKLATVTLTLFIAAGVHRSDGALSAQSVNPLTLPRLAVSNITYTGGFRLPATAQGDDFSYGGSHMAYNPARNSLFVNSVRHKVAEVTIPAAVNTTDIDRMSFASYLQPFSDPSEGRLHEMGDGTILAGLLVHGNRLYATGSIYYDGDNEQVVSHFSRSTNLSEPSMRGMSQVWETGRAGYVGGYMASVPAQWHALLGGPAITGQCCIPVVRRTSYGPAAFGFDPAGIGPNTALPATPLLYYTDDHATLGPWLGSNEVYGASALMGGMAVIAGTRTALFVGRIGLGEYCYGKGVTDPAQHGLVGVDGPQCYDPGATTKGQHGWPYRYQIWAYDLADFAAVKAGAKQPWDVVPYAIWPLELPTPEVTVQIGGVAYDAQRQLLYISQMYADVDGRDGRDLRPIIHTLKITTPSSTAPPVPSMTLPIPPPPVSSVTLSTNLPAPQPVGSPIVFTAAPTSATTALLYKWFVFDGAWNAGGAWTSSNRFNWTPTVPNDRYRIKVWVKRVINTTDVAEAAAEEPFGIASVPTHVKSVTLGANLSAPQRAGSTIVWTATQSGGVGALVYKWFVFDGAWKPAGSWSSSNQFSWTPTVANDKYRVKVWVKRATNTADAGEAVSEKAFAISEVPTKVVSVALSANLPAPQRLGATIVWTATQTGGVGALVYKWWVFDGVWKPAGSWTSSNRFTWTPTMANDRYRVKVWVKRATNTAEAAEAATEKTFPITR